MEFAVYVLTWACGLQYVGSTKLHLHVRILQHLRTIVSSDPTYPVARHFTSLYNNDLSCLKYFVIGAVPPLRRGGNREKMLRWLESKFILNWTLEHRMVLIMGKTYTISYNPFPCSRQFSCSSVLIVVSHGFWSLFSDVYMLLAIVVYNI